MSAPVVLRDVVAVLLAAFASLVAPVVPLSVAVPVAVGVPDTVQVMELPGATLVGGTGEHDVVRPAGKPATAQLADAAVKNGELPFEHMNVPL